MNLHDIQPSAQTKPAIKGAKQLLESLIELLPRTRLWRGEPETKRKLLDIINTPWPSEFRGRWFSPEIEEAARYSGPDGRLFYIDIPTADLEKYKVGNNPSILNPYRPDSEYILPQELTDWITEFTRKTPY